MAFGATLTLPTISGSHSDFPVLLREDDFPAAAIDGTGDAIDNGGGNLRAYTSSAKTTQLALEVVAFVSGGTPFAIVHVKIPIAATGNTIFIEADAVESSQPAVGAAFGRNAVWSDYEAVLHMDETGTDGVFVDSTGNGHDTTLTTGSTLATTTANHPFGGDWPDFTELEALTLTSSKSMLDGGDLTLSIWGNFDVVADTDGLFGNRHNTPDDNWAHFQSTGLFFIKDSSTDEAINPSTDNPTATTLLNHAVFDSSTSVEIYRDGVSKGSDVTIGVASITGANDYLIGTYFNDASTRRLDGRACEARARASVLTSDWIATEFDNQDAASNWVTVGSWADTASASVDDVNTDEIIDDAETGNTLTVSDFGSNISTVKLISGTAETTALNLAGTGDNYTFDNVDIAAFTEDTVGAPLTSANNVVQVEADDGTETAVLTVANNPKSGWARVEIASAVKTVGSIFENFVGTITDESEVYYPTADNTTVDATGIVTTDSIVDITMQFWDESDDTWKQLTLLIEDDGVPGGILMIDGSTSPNYFHNGLPYESDEALAVDDLGVVDHYHQGLPFTAVSRLVVDFSAAAIDYHGHRGFPFTAEGRLLCSNAALDRVQSSLPYTVSGAIKYSLGSP